jgi:hypothetical protein
MISALFRRGFNILVRERAMAKEPAGDNSREELYFSEAEALVFCSFLLIWL